MFTICLNFLEKRGALWHLGAPFYGLCHVVIAYDCYVTGRQPVLIEDLHAYRSQQLGDFAGALEGSGSPAVLGSV